MAPRLHRQSFLGEQSDQILKNRKAAVIGLGGGGSHIVQQLAHVGVGAFVIADPDFVEESNLNRLVGATSEDAEKTTPKVHIARRLIQGINPSASVIAINDRWQGKPNLIRDCDVIFGCVDSYTDRDQLERMARRFLIPYIDIGMDVHPLGKHFSISGQVAVSMPGEPCLWCMGLLREELLAEESRTYGSAGSRPQVIWPNGILASTAVGIFVQIVTPWHNGRAPILMEYNGNLHTVEVTRKITVLNQKICSHFTNTDVGDPFFNNSKTYA